MRALPFIVTSPPPRRLPLPPRSRAGDLRPPRAASVLFALCLLAGCGADREKVVREELGDNPTAGRGLEEARIYTWTAPVDGLLASSHYVVTPEAVTVFDAQLLPEYAEALYQDIRKHTRAPIAAIYITHPHPDHHFGASQLVAHTRIDLSSTAETARHIEATGSSKLIFWRSFYADRLPDRIIVPAITFSGEKPGGAGGAILRLRELDLQTSPNPMIAWLPRTRELIAGELVYQGSHLRMADISTEEWLRALEALKAYQPRVVYPGHGAPGGIDLIDQNIRYLKTVQGIVARYVTSGTSTLSKETLEAIRKELLAIFPDLANPEFLDLTIPAEFSRQHMARAS